MGTIDIKAEIPGTVWKIELSVDADVSEDDSILILESMKMEIPVTAPRDGKITEILVAEGETVTEGQVVARMAT